METAPKWTLWRQNVSKVSRQSDHTGQIPNGTLRLDWGTRRRPLGAIVAWSSLALFAVLTILGIAGMVMSLQAKPTATPALVTAEVAPEPVRIEERLPEQPAFIDVQQAVAVSEPEPAVEAVAASDDLIAATFEQLVEPVVVPADQVPEGAVAVQPAASATVVADARVELPMSPEGAALSPKPRVVGRNAAALAIESEVPDTGRNITALGYAAQPEDDTVRVGDSRINVRSGPSQAHKRLFALSAGAEVEVTGKSGDWVAIIDSKERKGWVDASLLENVDLKSLSVVQDPPAAEPDEPADATNLRKVAGSGVTVRAGPGKSNKSLFNLPAGSEVQVLDDSRGWLKIKDAQGRTGWAYKNYIKG